MQVKELKQDGLSYELEVILEAKEIDQQIDARLQEVAKTVKIPGFRPGKVPLPLLKQRYGQAVLGEVLEKAVNDSSAKALEDKKLRPALQPKIEVKEFDQGKDLKYTLAVEVLPEFKVMDFKGMTLEKPVVKADKKAVDDALDRIAKQNKETRPIEGKRAAKEGDTLVIDFHGRTKKDNKEHQGMHAHGHRLELGSNQFIAGFEDQLVGKKAGDKVAVEVTFPDPYYSDELAGQDAIFDVEIHEIHESVESKPDDEFAKKLGFDDLKALREAIENQIQSEYDQVSRMKLKRSLLDMLDDGHDFAIPSGMLDLEYESIKQQVRLERQDEVKDGKLNLSDEEEEELRAIAERRVRLGLILSEVGRDNNIQVADQELQRAVIMEAQRYPGQEAEVFDYYSKNRQALEALRAPVFEDKVVDFILQLADVKDKPVSLEELTADDEESYLDQKKAKGGKAKSGGKSGSSSSTKKTAAAKAKTDTKTEGQAGSKKAAEGKKTASKAKSAK